MSKSQVAPATIIERERGFGDARHLRRGLASSSKAPCAYRPIETGGKIVEHHGRLAGIEQRVNHVASDISGAAGDQDRHAGGPAHIAKLWRRSPSQYGALAGLLELTESFYLHLAAEYQEKRNQLCTALTKAGLTPSVPRGAYYVLADASRVPGKTAPQKARELLKIETLELSQEFEALQFHRSLHRKLLDGGKALQSVHYDPLGVLGAVDVERWQWYANEDRFNESAPRP